MKEIQAKSKQGQRYIASYLNSRIFDLEGKNAISAYVRASDRKRKIWRNINDMIEENNSTNKYLHYGIPYIISHNVQFFTVAFVVYHLTGGIVADLMVITPSQDILIKGYIVDGVKQV